MGGSKLSSRLEPSEKGGLSFLVQLTEEKKQITLTTLLGQGCINSLRWEASGHGEPRSAKRCKRKTGRKVYGSE